MSWKQPDHTGRSFAANERIIRKPLENRQRGMSAHGVGDA
jgi:hypothetical protein